MKLSFVRNQRQLDTTNWAFACFPEQEVTSLAMRSYRSLEEQFELAQFCKVPLYKIITLAHHVYSKPVGDGKQELGGCGIALLVLASIMGVSAEECEETEFNRVLSLSREHFKQRNKAKTDAGLWVNAELETQDKIEDKLLATADAIAKELQEAKDTIAKYKTKFGEL